MSVLADPQTEKKLLAIIADEGRIFGAPKARAWLDSLGLQPEDFSDRHARLVFEAFSASLAGGVAPLIEVLLPELARRTGREVDFKTTELFVPFFKAEEVATSEEARGLAVALRNLASRRRAYEAARRIIALAETGEAVGHELAEEMHQAANTVPGKTGTWSTAAKGRELAARRIRLVQDGRLNPNVPTGYHELDEAIGGMQPTFCVLCGQPGVVKSGVVGSILRNVAMRGETAALFSIEDRIDWLGFRYLAHHSGVPQFVLRNFKLAASQWNDVAAADTDVAQWDSRILVDDRPHLKPAEILFAAREALSERGAQSIWVDNLSAIKFKNGDRRDLEIQDFAERGRALADEFKVPFVVVAHTDTKAAKPTDIPQLWQCREAPNALHLVSRMALGIALSAPPKPDAPPPTIEIGVLKTQFGRPGSRVSIPFHARSGLLDDSQLAPQRQEGLL